jgi:hypothetical protein
MQHHSSGYGKEPVLFSGFMLRFLGAVLAWTATFSPAFGWNATGHRIVAAIAYERLTPQTRARVDALIREHPDYESIFLRDAPSDPVARARAAFIAAAVWPDVIKGDPRFWDDTHNDAQPTPPLPGFPDVRRHTNWHYYDTPYTPDGAAPKKQPPPNARTELPRLMAEIGTAPEPVAAYDLPWIEHLIGDVHQPLHCVSRVLKSQPGGDQGGNLVILGARLNLHSLWDDAAGRDTSDAYVTQYAGKVTAEHPAPEHIEKNPKKWIRESFRLDQTQVYTFGLETGSKDHPLQLPEGYVENAKRVSRDQIAEAGYRLAAVLNEKLK